MMLSPLLAAAENGLLPDPVIRVGVRQLLDHRLLNLESARQQNPNRETDFRLKCQTEPIAPVPELANAQHYELPAVFFQTVLGPQLKYSCCYFEPNDDLANAEERALAITAEHAGVVDGQRILELGCGWGSLSLWLAKHFPQAQITAVSNSNSQREFIISRANREGLSNLTVITADMNSFAPEGCFDRVVSVEMFEHMRNHKKLMARIADWLKPEGKLFVHIFCHREHSYEFTTEGPGDWMGRTFFSGGVMPSASLLAGYDEDLMLTADWTWSGEHYHQTCEHWLKRQDENRDSLLSVMQETYGASKARIWFQRWRIFFLACSELFNYRGGEEWFVKHYLFEQRA